MARAVTQFALSGLVAVAVLGLIAVGVLQRTGRNEAIRDATHETALAGRGIVEPEIRPGLLRGDPAAVAALDRVVRRRALNAPVVRVKIWDASGRVLYSDDHRLIGSRYQLGADERAALRAGSTDAEVSDLSKPENRFERRFHKLLEVYLGIRAPGGQRLLYEDYLRYSSVAASGRRLWSSFAPALIVSLVLLGLTQVPLAWSLARRLRRGEEERVALLRRAIDASEQERRSIARDLHDGAVQDLAGVSYGLSATAQRVREHSLTEEADALDEAAAQTRESIRGLRTLLVDLYPPTLRRAGLRSALSDLAASVSARDIEVRVELDAGLELPPDKEELLYRAAQEALRNVVRHADARTVRLYAQRVNGRAALGVEDDGRGFAAGDEGGQHFGMRILSDLVREAGGELAVDSAPGAGTRVRIEVPV